MILFCFAWLKHQYIFKSLMEPMEDENSSMEFEEVYNSNKSPQDLLFDQYIDALQEVVIDSNFERKLGEFMKNHWVVFDDKNDKEAEVKVFHQYRAELQNYLEKNIRQRAPDFQWETFSKLLEERKHMVDEQILDTLLSLEDVENFKLFIKDFRNSYEEEELLQTIKTNKISQNKKVKGKDNIFAGGDLGSGGGLFDKGLKAPKKKATKEKAEEELLVPELILTVRPMRKN